MPLSDLFIIGQGTPQPWDSGRRDVWLEGVPTSSGPQQGASITAKASLSSHL